MTSDRTAAGIDHENGLRGLRGQRGQASVEYLVVCTALAIALGIGMVDNRSVLRELLDAFKLAYQKISFAISLPA